MKIPTWNVKWQRHPHRAYYQWSAVVLTAMSATILFITLFTPALGSAHGLARSMILAADTNVTPLEIIPKVPPGEEKLKGKTLQQQCQARVAKQYWGVCCSPPDYAASEACQNALKGQPPKDREDEDAPLTPAELKLLPVVLQKELAQIKKQIEQFAVQVEQAKAEATNMAQCELGCPGGARAIQCTQEDMDVCIAHDNCIRACDKNFPQLEKKINQLKKKEADILKKAAALKKRVDAYKAKNKRKFRAIEGASH